MKKLRWTEGLVEETCAGCGEPTRKGDWILEDAVEGVVWCESCVRRNGVEMLDQDINE
jgi:hypothetical protein